MRARPPDSPVNLTPMIDIVFQIIIFFILTIDLDKEKITLEHIPDAPHGEAVEEEEQSTVHVQIETSGKIRMGSAVLSLPVFKGIMKQTIRRSGRGIPVVIYGNKTTLHKDIRVVLDVCSQLGLWKISFGAIQQHASN